MPVDKGGTNTTSLTGDRVLKSASDGLSVEPLTGTGVLKLTSDAPTVAALGTADLPTIPVSGGGTGATTAAAARTALVVVQKGASGRDEAQVTKLYDSSGNVIAEINASGGVDVGSPATSADADGLAVEGDVSVEGTINTEGITVNVDTGYYDGTSYYRQTYKSIIVSTSDVNLDLLIADMSASHAACIGTLEIWGLRADNANGKELWQCYFAAGENAPTFSVGTLTTLFSNTVFPADPVVAWSGTGTSRTLQLQLSGTNHSYSVWVIKIEATNRKGVVTV
jgi:hypothetical protein